MLDSRPNVGAPGRMNLTRSFLDLRFDEKRCIFSHECGHALRGLNGIMAPPTGPMVTFDRRFYRPIGWWREEMHNTGLIPSLLPYATENAYRYETGMNLVLTYNGVGAREYQDMMDFITAGMTMLTLGNMRIRPNNR